MATTLVAGGPLATPGTSVHVRVTAPGNVAERVAAELRTLGALPMAPLAWTPLPSAGPNGRPGKENVEGVKVSFASELQTLPRGAFGGRTPEELRETFGSFPDASVVWVEATARFDGGAWTALAEALPAYEKLRWLEIHGGDIDAEQLHAVLHAAARCPKLQGLCLGVAWDGEASESGQSLPVFPELQSLTLSGVAVPALVRAEAWLSRLPRLQQLRLYATEDRPIAAAYEGLKRGVLRGMREYTLRELRSCKAIILDAPLSQASRSAGKRRWDMLDPQRPCAFRMRPDDYAAAAAHAYNEVPYGAVEDRRWTLAFLGAGTFAALRHRQWMRHLMLRLFVYEAQRLVASPSASGAMVTRASLPGALRGMAALPRELWCFILEWWLGGHIKIQGGRRQ